MVPIQHVSVAIMRDKTKFDVKHLSILKKRINKFAAINLIIKGKIRFRCSIHRTISHF
jgi:hypothetical protein